LSSRIALIPSSYAPYVGGVEEHAYHVARQLKAAGNDVEVWTALRDGLPATERIDDTTVRRLPCPMPTASPGGLMRFLKAAPASWTTWSRAVAQFRPDVMHVHCYAPTAVHAHLHASRSRLPLVLSLHGETFMDDHAVFEDSWLLRQSLKRSLRHAGAVTGCSQITLDDASQRFGLPVGTGQLVANGVEIDDVPEAARSTWTRPFDRYVTAVGRMVPHKGFDLLLEAFARLNEASTVGLVLGGDGPERPRLEQLAAALGMAERVVLPGRMDRSEVAAAMTGADIVVVPSRVEPFGIVVLEAWRAGAPVIATNRGGPSEFINDGVDGMLVDPLDTTRFALLLDRLLTDTDLRRSIGAAGRCTVQQYTWSRTAHAYTALYTQILDREGQA
jgi:glycogen synthase